jgi:hypothetical protein
MAAWPELDELKQLLDVTSEDFDGNDDYELTRLSRVLAAAIDRVKNDVGAWDEDTDAPTERLAQAALRMAELLATRPDLDFNARSFTLGSVMKDATYSRLIYGHRRKFGVA